MSACKSAEKKHFPLQQSPGVSAVCTQHDELFSLESEDGTVFFFYLLGLVKCVPGRAWIWIYHISFTEAKTSGGVQRATGLTQNS